MTGPILAIPANIAKLLTEATELTNQINHILNGREPILLCDDEYTPFWHALKKREELTVQIASVLRVTNRTVCKRIERRTRRAKTADIQLCSC